MKKILILGSALALVLGLVLIAGCSSGDANAQSCSACGMAVGAEDAKTVDGKVFCSHCGDKAGMAADAVATHDCQGDCGMKAVPKAMLTEIDGKLYCKGCKAKMEHDKAEGGHEGHSH